MAILENGCHNEPPLLYLTSLVSERSPNRADRPREFATWMITAMERSFAHRRTSALRFAYWRIHLVVKTAEQRHILYLRTIFGFREL